VFLACVSTWSDPQETRADLTTQRSFLRPHRVTMLGTPSSAPAPLPPVIGHRGAKQIAPENTIASMRAAKQLGVGVVEVDVMLSKDDVLFIHHDNKLDRCTDGSGYLWDHTASELRGLDAGSHFSTRFAKEPLPMLSELLLECKALGLGVNLEIKHATDHGDEEPTAEEVARERRLAEVTSSFIRQLGHGLADPNKVFFSSFSVAALEVLAERLPEYKRSYLVCSIPTDWEETYQRLGCVSLNFDHKRCSRDEVVAVSSKVPCFSYTVNDASRAMELLSWGVSGVFSDCPKDIMDCITAYNQAIQQRPSPLKPMSRALRAGA